MNNAAEAVISDKSRFYKALNQFDDRQSTLERCVKKALTARLIKRTRKFKNIFVDEQELGFGN